MILRKPYGFLIRHFKLIHLIISGILISNAVGIKYKTSKTEKINGSICSVILLAILIFIIVIAGIGAGLIVGLSTKYAITKDDLIIEYSNSVVVNKDKKEGTKILDKHYIDNYQLIFSVKIQNLLDLNIMMLNGIHLKHLMKKILNMI